MKNMTLAAAFACFSIHGSAGHGAVIGDVFSFGDSLNDCCVNPAAPFTNGSETWLVEFADLLGATYRESTTNNYATGGAQSGDFNAIAPGGVKAANGLRSQVARFKADAPDITEDDLAVIWVGTNDIWPSSYDGENLFGVPGLEIVKPLGDMPEIDRLADHVAGNIREAVVDLRDSGFGNALVMTPYDIGNSALFDIPSGPDRNTAYSEALRDRILDLFTPGIDTYALDVVALIRDLQAGSPGNGFLELSTAPSCSFGSIVCENRSPAEQDSFIFYDFVHLTTATNSEVAAAAANLVGNGAPVAPVPLPASVFLLIAALGGLVVLRRRPST